MEMFGVNSMLLLSTSLSVWLIRLLSQRRRDRRSLARNRRYSDGRRVLSCMVYLCPKFVLRVMKSLPPPAYAVSVAGMMLGTAKFSGRV
jgi:hypothetical protein